MKPRFDDVVKQYIKLVYYFTIKLCPHEDTDDIVGNTFLKAFKSYEGFEYESDPQLKSWLLTICRNTINDRHKAIKPLLVDAPTLETLESTDSADSWLEGQIQDEQVKEVLTVLDGMDPIDQQIVKLKIYDELTFLDIAQILESTEAATKMRFYRAVKSLRAQL